MVRTIIALFGVAILFCFATVSDAGVDLSYAKTISSAATALMALLHDVYFTNNQNGLVVGDNGLMLVTTDGGKTWEKWKLICVPPVPGKDPADVRVLAVDPRCRWRSPG